MANKFPNFRASLDLSKLKGAKILNITQDGKTMPCVVIPCAFNDMLTTDKEGNVRVTPYLGINFWGCNDNFIAKCVENHADTPDYVPPSHHVEVAFSKEFRERAKKKAEERILKEKPDISPEELNNAKHEALRITLGTLTPMRSQGQRSYAPQGSATASAPTDAPFNPAVSTDDLPF